MKPQELKEKLLADEDNFCCGCGYQRICNDLPKSLYCMDYIMEYMEDEDEN